jgi:hypothetical protein
MATGNELPHPPPSRSSKESRNKDRGWEKYVAEMAYGLRGLHPFVSALRSHYRADDEILHIEGDRSGKPRTSIANSFVNLATVEDVEAELAQFAAMNGRAAADIAADSGEIHRSLLLQHKYQSVDGVLGALEDRGRDCGWTCVQGRAGMSLLPAVQLICCRWGEHEKTWHDRFDFVFRVKLSLLALTPLMESSPDPSSRGENGAGHANEIS